MGQVIIPRNPSAGGAVAITYQGQPNKAVYWEVFNIDPKTGEEGVGRGCLKWRCTRTNKAGLSLNFYFAPKAGRGLELRYDTGRIYDTHQLTYDDNPALLEHGDRIKTRTR